MVEEKPLQSSPGSLLAWRFTVTGLSPSFLTITVYSPESPGLTVWAFGETKTETLSAAETGVAIMGIIATSIKLTKKNAARLERRAVLLWLSIIRGERLSIKRLSFDVRCRAYYFGLLANKGRDW